jgi:hypothetical protein
MGRKMNRIKQPKDAKPPKNNKVFVRNVPGAYMCVCGRCGGEFKIVPQMLVEHFTQAMETFNELHRYCAPITQFSDEPIHEWFELSYAQYLTIPRSALQSMHESWQARFVQCLNELDELIDWRPNRGRYRVVLSEIVEEFDEEEGRDISQWGDEIEDPLQDYERGRRRLPPKLKEGSTDGRNI